jgi:hypothetical protein
LDYSFLFPVSNFFAYSPGSADSEPPYSTSLVLKGSHDQLRFSREDGAEPEIIPELQGRGVTKVALGSFLSFPYAYAL